MQRTLNSLVTVIQSITVSTIGVYPKSKNIENPKRNCFQDDLVTILDSVSGRKNPSNIQIKQLKRTMPNSFILKQLIISQVCLIFFESVVLILLFIFTKSHFVILF